MVSRLGKVSALHLANNEQTFYYLRMARAKTDRIIVAEISGIAARHARQQQLTEPARETAIAELASVAPGRGDLLAEHAGIIIGAHEGALDEASALRAAQLCIDAGADVAQIPRWVAEGRRRARDAEARRSANW